MYKFLIGCLFFVATMIACAPSRIIKGTGLSWRIKDNTLTISGNGAMPDYTNIIGIGGTAPWNFFRKSFIAVTIENGVTSVGKWAFVDRIDLKSVIIPESVTSIGDYAFSRCQSLTSVIIPNSVTDIGSCAFGGCRGLASITISNSVTIIKNLTFVGCLSLTSVIIPNSVTTIEDYAFMSCKSLNSIIIPNSVNSIGINAFFSCNSLKSVTIPNSVTFIGIQAFGDCASLTEIINYAITPQTIDTSEFNGVDKTKCTLRVPVESIAAYRAAEGWKDFENIVAITE